MHAIAVQRRILTRSETKRNVSLLFCGTNCVMENRVKQFLNSILGTHAAKLART